MKLKYDLKGLDCANCAQKVQERVSDLKGIKECNVEIGRASCRERVSIPWLRYRGSPYQ